MNSRRPRAYLDANVFIVAFENKGARSDHAWWILNAIEQGEIAGATSELTLAEILVKPIESQAADLISAYKAMIVSGANFEVATVGRDILVGAAELRAARPSTKLPDAIHIATAKALDCAVMVSDDRRMKLPEGMRLIEMNPFTLDDILKAPK